MAYYQDVGDLTTSWSYTYDGLDYDPGEMRACEERGTWLATAVKAIVYSLGIVGIVLTVVVLSRKTMCTSTNCYLTALAIADLVVLVMLSVQLAMTHIMSCYSHLEDFTFSFFHIITILINMALFASVWITVVLAVERYIAICHPMQAMSICTTRRARIVIALIFVASLIVRFPNFFDMALVEKRLYDDHNNTYVKLVMEWGREDVYDNAIYSFIVPGFLASLLPVVTLAVLNTRLVIEIRKSTRYLRYHLAGDSRIQSIISHEEKRITLMLIFIVIAFFIFQCPYMVYVALTALNNYWFQRVAITGGIQSMHDAGLIVLAIKSACNFILYCWFSEKFWTTFKQIFCLRHCLPEQPLVHNGHGNGCQRNSHASYRTSCFFTRETTC